jgi:glycosyltransferase involved in cell wall biosynthesis
VHNSVSTDPIERVEIERVLRDLGIPTGAPVVCGVGRLGRVKGLDLLIAAFTEVLGAFPDARLLIVGEGTEKATLASSAVEAGIAESVVLAGHSDRVRTILASVDVYVLSSRYEGMANTLLEAMSVGAPIVATDVSGTREAVRDGVDALVVPPDDSRAIRDAVLRLLRNRELAGALGQSALARAESLFSPERMADGVEGILYAGRPGQIGNQGGT